MPVEHFVNMVMTFEEQIYCGIWWRNKICKKHVYETLQTICSKQHGVYCLIVLRVNMSWSSFSGRTVVSDLEV